MKHINRINPLLLLFFLITACSAQPADTKTDKIDRLVSLYSEYGTFNGTILVAEKGKIIYKKAFGWANAESKTKNTIDTKFRLASITKQFTAMLMVQLAAEKKLKLDVPISTYLPDYPKKTGDIITIHHLLTHSSGIPNYTSFPNFQQLMGKQHSPEEIIKIFCDSTLEFRPGEKFAYSNSGYILLGYIIEKVTGKTYGQVLEEKIFKPLNMVNTCYNPNDDEIKNKARGYGKAGSKLEPAASIHMSFPFAAGGIYSTVEDMYAWDQALYTEKLVPAKYRDLLFQKHIPDGDGDYYGYGWEIGMMTVGNTNQEVEVINHGGSINGFGTIINRIPADKSVVIILNNTGNAPLVDMTISITGILRDQPYDLPKKSIAIALLETMEKDGVEKGLSLYEKIKTSDNYYYDEQEVNMTGYELLWANKTSESIAVFKLNTEKNPDSFNAYDSYAEALLKQGDTTASIENYKKSVQLNPGSRSGLNALQALGVNTADLIKKISIEELKVFEGEYLVTNPPSERDKEWKIQIQVQNGELTGNDRGYKYKLLYVGNNAFVNPDDGASLVFSTRHKESITMTLFKRFEFKKVK